MTVHMQTLSPVTFHGYYQNCQYQKDLAIPIVGPYSPSLSWFITQSGLCIKKKFLYVMIARIGIYACSGTQLALMYQLIEVILGLGN